MTWQLKINIIINIVLNFYIYNTINQNIGSKDKLKTITTQLKIQPLKQILKYLLEYEKIIKMWKRKYNR